ncbi:MAG: hypothetical protein IJ200_11075 [Prevotella sp.]|nr:hypothetical protein [Prevotella sp.]
MEQTILDKVRARAAAAILLLALTACTDTLYDDGAPRALADDGIQFMMTTMEQADMTISVGGATRSDAAPDSVRQAARLADRFLFHPLSGAGAEGLRIRRMPLPFVGIHRAAVHRGTDYGEAATRASVDDIVSADGTNFHDSLTLWGCVYNQQHKHRFLFGQTLLKRIRNWRSSVQWPYENTTEGDYGHETVSDAPWRGEYMRFCAVAPAFESLNISMVTPPQYESGTLIPPTFHYTLPETVAEMRDVLFGSSDPVLVDVQAGPQGDGTQKAENLGQDNKLVNLTFQHVMTALRFAVGTLPADVTIKKIALRNVAVEATYNPAATEPVTGSMGAWTLSAPHLADYELPVSVTSVTAPNNYIDGGQVMFMIPHTVTEAALLEVVIEAKPKYTYSETGRTEYTGDETRSHTLRCSLTGDIWKKGYTVTYQLTIGEVEDGYYMLADSPGAQPHSDSPITGTFPVHSYRSYYDYAAGQENTTHAVNWKVVGYSDTEDGVYTMGNKPAWIYSLGGVNNGKDEGYIGGEGSQATFILTRQEYVKSGNHRTILLGNNTPASRRDLSRETPNGKAYVDDEQQPKQQPANSYIVNRSGSYIFPLYYGNGNISGSGSDFVDHAGHTITHADIKSQIEYNNSLVAITEDDDTHGHREEYKWAVTYTGEPPVLSNYYLRAVVVWQDVDGLVTLEDASGVNVSNTADGEYQKGMITFRVSSDPEKLQPGNAVIALQARKVLQNYKRDNKDDTSWDTDGSPQLIDGGDNWETLWTWHIWVTDEVYTNDGGDDKIDFDKNFLNWDDTNKTHIVEVENKDGTKNKILPVNLGWVPDNLEFGYYAKRECWVKLQQVEPSTGGATTTAHIVQHARQPLITGTSTVYQWGRPTALPMVQRVNGTARTIYTNTAEFGTYSYRKIDYYWEFLAHPLNILKSSNSSNSKSWFTTPMGLWSTTSKTVYDPCPPGFQMPAGDVFTGMSLTGAAADVGTSLNMWSDAGEAGKGGYFYTTKHITTPPELTEDNRYGQTFYMPATGRWSGDQQEGEAVFKYDDKKAGTYWLGSSKEDAKTGHSLWFVPDNSYTGNPKRAIIPSSELNAINNALPIRPTGDLPATKP